MFEVVLGILRTYLFAHTTNRIDVELGARLFRHLLALPIAYFQARRVGDTVARVRELENIRNFLTGSGLTDYARTGGVCGVPLPAGLVDGSRLPEAIFTPTTPGRCRRTASPAASCFFL